MTRAAVLDDVGLLDIEDEIAGHGIDLAATDPFDEKPGMDASMEPGSDVP